MNFNGKTLEKGVEGPITNGNYRTYPGPLEVSARTVPFRQLHQQIRNAPELEKKHSLRICRWLPWIRHTVGGIPLPEDEALPCNDRVCNGILGTTLAYYVYDHLR